MYVQNVVGGGDQDQAVVELKADSVCKNGMCVSFIFVVWWVWLKRDMGGRLLTCFLLYGVLSVDLYVRDRFEIRHDVLLGLEVQCTGED